MQNIFCLSRISSHQILCDITKHWHDINKAFYSKEKGLMYLHHVNVPITRITSAVALVWDSLGVFISILLRYLAWYDSRLFLRRFLFINRDFFQHILFARIDEMKRPSFIFFSLSFPSWRERTLFGSSGYGQSTAIIGPRNTKRWTRKMEGNKRYSLYSTPTKNSIC